MIRIFLDSSVLFSAAYSSRGRARELILRAARGELTLVVSDLVLEETRRNLAENAPHSLPYLHRVIETVSFELIRPTKREVLEAAKIVVLKDAAILAAAKKAEVDFLVTLDRKHLLGKPELEQFAGAPIVSPKEALERITPTI